MIKKITLFCLKTYRNFVSPWFLQPLFGASCRFTPSCSSYTYQAIKRYGTIRGSFLAIMRILRCNPFSSGGHDPLK